MASWAELEVEAPEVGAAGRRLLVGDDGVAIGFLATTAAHGVPHLSPVCPIFCLDIERALWVHWERVGQPDTRPVRRRWRAQPR